MIKSNMNTREFIEYAKDNGYDSIMFSVKKNGSHVAAGKMLDAYYEFIKVPVVGNGFLSIKDLESTLGYNITFDVIDKNDFITAVRLDFLLRGKEIPKEYQFCEED